MGILKKLMGSKPSKAKQLAMVEAVQKKNEEEALYCKKQNDRETLQTAVNSVGRKMNTKRNELKSFKEQINEIKVEKENLESRANEAITTYGNNVQSIMLYHGIASIFLQLAFPYAGLWITILMVISFFSTLLVASTSTYDKFQRTTQLNKDLQRRLRELEKEVAGFAATTKMIYSDNEMKILAQNGCHGEVIENVNFINTNVATLQKDIAEIDKLSQSESDRMKSFLQVAGGAVMFGLCFPMVSYGLLSLIGFRKTGAINII